MYDIVLEKNECMYDQNCKQEAINYFEFEFELAMSSLNNAN